MISSLLQVDNTVFSRYVSIVIPSIALLVADLYFRSQTSYYHPCILRFDQIEFLSSYVAIM